MAKVGRPKKDKAHCIVCDKELCRPCYEYCKRCVRLGDKSNLWKGGIWNYARKLFHNRQRNFQRKGASGSHTFGEWQTLKTQYNWTCPACGKKEPQIKLTEDHIIPLSRGGSDNIENIQPLCAKCNSIKYTKTIRYEM